MSYETPPYTPPGDPAEDGDQLEEAYNEYVENDIKKDDSGSAGNGSPAPTAQ
jgi:hypothetical protein